jgi:hypothetical protein
VTVGSTCVKLARLTGGGATFRPSCDDCAWIWNLKNELAPIQNLI